MLSSIPRTIANLFHVSSEGSLSPTDSIRLHLLQFSTGMAHPGATKATIDIETRPTLRKGFGIKIEIVGPYLLLWMFEDANNDGARVIENPRDKLLMFDWNSGRLLVVSFQYN